MKKFKFIFLIIILTFISVYYGETDILYDISNLAKKTKSACVTIRVFDHNNQMVNQGSGFFISANKVITLGHVLWKNNGYNHSKVWISTNAEKPEYMTIKNVLYYDNRTDILLFDVIPMSFDMNGTKQNFLLAAKNFLEGEFVVVISSPQDIEGVISYGIVSKIHDESYFQLSTPIGMGSSGAPVMNKKGQVIGIIHGSLNKGQLLNIAVRIFEGSGKLDDIKYPSKLPYKDWVKMREETVRGNDLVAVLKDYLIPKSIRRIFTKKANSTPEYKFGNKIPIADTQEKQWNDNNLSDL